MPVKTKRNNMNHAHKNHKILSKIDVEMDIVDLFSFERNRGFYSTNKNPDDYIKTTKTTTVKIKLKNGAFYNNETTVNVYYNSTNHDEIFSEKEFTTIKQAASNYEFSVEKACKKLVEQFRKGIDYEITLGQWGHKDEHLKKLFEYIFGRLGYDYYYHDVEEWSHYDNTFSVAASYIRAKNPCKLKKLCVVKDVCSDDEIYDPHGDGKLHKKPDFSSGGLPHEC